MNDNTDSFLGTGWAFPPAFSRAGGTVATSSDRRDVEEALRILVGTLPGQRVMLPDFGTGMRDLVFGGTDVGSQTLLFDRLRTAVLQYEPRIEVLELSLDDSRITEGVVELRMAYRIRSTNSRFNFVHPFYRTEGSQIPTP